MITFVVHNYIIIEFKKLDQNNYCSALYDNCRAIRKQKNPYHFYVTVIVVQYCSWPTIIRAKIRFKLDLQNGKINFTR